MPVVRRMDPRSLHRRVAESLSPQFPFDVRTGQHFTMLYGVLDTERRTWRFVLAGHPLPIHQPRDQAPRFLEASGFPIGIIPEARYEDTEVAQQGLVAVRLAGRANRVTLYKVLGCGA